MNPNTRRAIALIGAELAMAASIGVAGMVGLSGKAQATPEDSPSWDCRTMGNHVCGPYNPQGADPGLYDQGRLVADLTYCPSDRTWSLEWHSCGIGSSAARATPWGW